MTAAPESGIVTCRFSSDDYHAARRVDAWREIYARKFLGLEHVPLAGRPFHANMTLQMLPGLRIMWGNASLQQVARTRELLADGNDDLILTICSHDGLNAQRGREVKVAAGDAILLSAAEIGSVTYRTQTKAVALSLPRKLIAPLLGDLDSVLGRSVPKDNSALRLLTRYLEIFKEPRALADPALQYLAAAHVHDLVSVALGATREAAEIAEGRGVRAARLHAVKADIDANIGERGLSIQVVAARHQITPVYVRKLFEAEGVTFSEYLLARRLARAYRLLSDPRFRERTVSAIAFMCGFGDLSYFNRTFRRRFGATPSDVREAAARADS
jgi:AraC-like DNA-binding protein